MNSVEKGEKGKMRESSKLGILLLALLVMSLFAGAYFVSGTSDSSMIADKARSNHPSPNEQVTVSDPTAEKPLTNIIVDSDAPQFASDNDVAGSSGSGWKPDVNIVPGSIYTARDEVNPSIATYIDSSTGAVTLWAAMQSWDSYYSHWFLWVFASNDRGATWWQRGAAAWVSNRSIINPSIAVSPYNGTVFVAVQNTAFGGSTNDIQIHVISPVALGPWASYNIDADADDDLSPQLVSEYGWGTGNWLHVSYERYVTYDDRDLCYGNSGDWGKTWSTKVLQGAVGTPGAADVFTQSDIAFVQDNVYVAYRHSIDYNTQGIIEVMYSTNFGGTFKIPVKVSPTKNTNARWPTVIGSHKGPWNEPTTMWIAYQNASGSPTYGDVFACWSKDFGDTWSSPVTIAGTSYDEGKPQLSVDGMGTENGNVPGYIHLVYWTSENTASRTNGVYYTQIAYFEPTYAPAPQVYLFEEGWSTPKGQIIDNNGYASATYNTPTITTFTRTVAGETLWVPGVAWTDLRNPNYDVYFTTLDTMFRVTVYPSTQTVVAGGSLSYYITVTLNSGATATATLDIVGPNTYHLSSANVWGHTFNPPTVTPTATSLLTFNTANFLGPGSYSIRASAVIGGYRRTAAVTFVVTASPTLTLNINPSTVARGSPLAINGQLTPGMATTVYLYYRYPHATGSWALATTIPTNAAGAYSVTATVPMSLTPGIYDLVAVWFNPANGAYTASPIRVLTIT
ncbi:MAG: hypothetical protein ABSB28_10590 [Candidatus Bathyarchaeia archaeon]